MNSLKVIIPSRMRRSQISYMDLAEKQEEVIYRLTQIVKKQANELSHIRSLYGFFQEETPQDIEDENLAKEALSQYEEMKQGDF